ncbi:MAG: dicarboxylate/amino acid:cation symporter [Proteobacteria bacterium]|nr:dicarboxylate/amino acid:cation symporter [Pseudomonadota bacterium]
MLRHLFQSLSLRLILLVGFVIFGGHHLPLAFKSFLYAGAQTIQDLMVFGIPFLIFAYMFSCLVTFRHQAGKFLLILFLGVCISNATSTLLSYGVASSALHNIGILSTAALPKGAALVPMWSFKLPTLLSNLWALGLAIGAGIIAPLALNPEKVEAFANTMKESCNTVLSKVLLPMIPVLVVGFALKMQHEGTLFQAFETYGKVVLLFAATQVLYLTFLYGMSARFRPTLWAKTIGNALPSALAAFTTMSSLAALSSAIEGARKNTRHDPLVDAVVPATVNFHLVGDSIAIPIMALAIMTSFGMPMPGLETYLIFVFFFVMNKFAVAAVPAGGILVMIPVLKSYLGFTTDMANLILTLYVLFDAVCTTANILGNGIFAVFFTRVYRRMSAVAA